MVLPHPGMNETPEVSAPRRAPASRSMHLLVIDDDRFVLDSLRLVLELEGYQVEAAASGRNGLDVFEHSLKNGQTLDAVITDLGMPQMDGNAVARAVKQLSGTTPVILLTGREQADSKCVDHIVVKPPKLDVLRKILGQYAHATSTESAAP